MKVSFLPVIFFSVNLFCDTTVTFSCVLFVTIKTRNQQIQYRFDSSIHFYFKKCQIVTTLLSCPLVEYCTKTESYVWEQLYLTLKKNYCTKLIIFIYPIHTKKSMGNVSQKYIHKCLPNELC